jgi:hypothetical protein
MFCDIPLLFDVTTIVASVFAMVSTVAALRQQLQDSGVALVEIDLTRGWPLSMPTEPPQYTLRADWNLERNALRIVAVHHADQTEEEVVSLDWRPPELLPHREE